MPWNEIIYSRIAQPAVRVALVTATDPESVRTFHTPSTNAPSIAADDSSAALNSNVDPSVQVNSIEDGV